MFIPRPSVVEKYREELPYLQCQYCGCAEFTVKRRKLRLHGVEGDAVVNELSCHYCGEVVTLLP